MDTQFSQVRQFTYDKASDKPLVSVVTIFFNAERFIGEAIESVFAQTYGHWELLLVDDGSTDGSTEIARKCAEQHPGKVRYFDHEGHQNRGISASLNLGIRHAHGEFIGFVDADDVVLPNALEEQVALLKSHPDAAMVYGVSQWWYSWTGPSEDSSSFQKDDFVYELGVPPDALVQPPTLIHLFFFRQEAAIPCPCSILIRREAVERVGGFEESLRLYTDQSLYAKLCLEAPVFASSRCWSRYRQHPSSACATAQQAGQEYSARLAFLNWLADYLSRKGAKDPAIWRALERELWRCHHPRIDRVGGMMRQTLRLMSWSFRPRR